MTTGVILFATLKYLPANQSNSVEYSSPFTLVFFCFCNSVSIPDRSMPTVILEILLLLFASLQSFQLVVIARDCPLNLSWANLTLVASACSDQNERAKCCRNINAFVAISVAHYGNATGSGILGVPSASLDACLDSVSRTLISSGVSTNATLFCGLGTKIRLSFECQGRMTIFEMLQSPNFDDVKANCRMPLSSESSCRRCLNSGIIYLHHLIGTGDNVTLNACRDAAFVALTNTADEFSANDMASCYFSVEPLGFTAVGTSGVPEPSPSPLSAQAPIQYQSGIPAKEHHHRYKPILIPAIGITITGLSIFLLVVLMFLIRMKSRELQDVEIVIQHERPPISSRTLTPDGGQTIVFRRFSFKEIRRATNNFKAVLGRGKRGIIYKAKLDDGSLAAVKKMVREQGDEEFHQDVELLGRLHHRHIVALKGFCIDNHRRILVYEFVDNGSLKDNLNGKAPLRWQTRMRIAIDVAIALEYLHFYCDPPRQHGEIKSSNVLLDENYIAKVSDFRIQCPSRNPDGAFDSDYIGYLDPEYLVTGQLTDKSDVYSYGVLLLELLTGRQATQDGMNLVAWAQRFMASNSTLPILLDQAIADSLDLNELRQLVKIIKMCIREVGSARPSIKTVLRMLYEGLYPGYSGFMELVNEEEGACRNFISPTQADEISERGDDARYLHSSSSTSRSRCSRTVILDVDSP